MGRLMPRRAKLVLQASAVAVVALLVALLGWKVMQEPDGAVTFAPILQSGRIAAGGTWEVTGTEPAGIELEIAFRMGRAVAENRYDDQAENKHLALHSAE